MEESARALLTWFASRSFRNAVASFFLHAPTKRGGCPGGIMDAPCVRVCVCVRAFNRQKVMAGPSLSCGRKSDSYQY